MTLQDFTTDELRAELKRKPHIHGYQHIEDNTSYATEDSAEV